VADGSAWMMAAIVSPLAERVVRVLGGMDAAGRIRVAGLAAVSCAWWERCCGHAFLRGCACCVGPARLPKQEQEAQRVVVSRNLLRRRKAGRRPQTTLGIGRGEGAD